MQEEQTIDYPMVVGSILRKDWGELVYRVWINNEWLYSSGKIPDKFFVKQVKDRKFRKFN
jgi:hypothetical protein